MTTDCPFEVDSHIQQIQIKKRITRTKRFSPEKMVMNKVEIEELDRDGKLICSSVIHLIFTDTIEDFARFTARTVDCYEYDSLGRSIKHLRYHDNLDSAEWIVLTHYILDESSNVKEIFYEDLTYPKNSFTKTVIEDTVNNGYKVDLSFGPSTEVKRDSLGRTIYTETENGDFWKHVYDNHGNQTVFETSESVSSFTYDSTDRLTEVLITPTGGKSRRILHEYDDENEIYNVRHFDSSDELTMETTTIFNECAIIRSESIQYWNGFHETSTFETEYW